MHDILENKQANQRKELTFEAKYATVSFVVLHLIDYCARGTSKKGSN